MHQSSVSAERYGLLFTEFTDTNWKFTAVVTVIFFMLSVCLTFWIVCYLPAHQVTLEPQATIMKVLCPFMFVFPLIAVGLTFIAGFRAVKAYKKCH